MNLVRAIRAEWVRMRRTTTARVIAVGITVSVLQALGWALLGGPELQTWQGLLNWQTIYVTSLCAPLVALVGVLAVLREQRAREAGTVWRAPNPTMVRVARAMVLALVLLGFHLALFVPSLAWGRLSGLTDPPVARVLALALLCWALSLAPLALGLWLARWFGLIVPLVVALGWQILGTMLAESATWWANPLTWLVRPTLPLLGVHGNAVPLEPGSPVWEYTWWGPLLGSLALTVVFLAVDRLERPQLGGVRTASERRPAYRRVTDLPLDRVTPRPTVALAGSLRRTPIGWLLLGVVLALAPVAYLWGGQGVRGLVGYLLLPLGTTLLAVLAWQAQTPTLRSLITRVSTPGLGIRLLGICGGCVTAVAVIAAGLVAVSGGRHAIEFGIVAAVSGTTSVALALWLTTRFGPGAAIGVALGGVLFGAIFGGFFADSPLWVVGPSAWAYSATGPLRAAVASMLSLIALAGFVPLWLGAIRRHLALK